MSSQGSPLDGIRVIEVDNWMAGPSAAAILADMGAEVIKIESPAGDPMRATGRRPKIDDPEKTGYDYQYDVDNRGKLSVGINLNSPEGVNLLHRLAEKAQIFMCNLLPNRQARFSLDPATLLVINPLLVHATLTGYGTQGPDASRPGYDVTAFFGRSGLYDAMREGDEGIVPMARPGQGDHTTGLAMVGAILAALRMAEQTGEGQVVETSLYETAIWTQAADYSVTGIDHAPVRRRDRKHMLAATVNRFPCKDGKWLVVNMPHSSAWPLLCKALDREIWQQDERFEDARTRYNNMSELVDLIDEVMLTKPRDAWGSIFDQVGIVWGPVMALHEVVKDPQAEAIGIFPELSEKTIGKYRTVNSPMRFQNARVEPRGPAPRSGEHTQQVLTSLIGLEKSELARYVESKAVFLES